jgi:hypothetical protein
MLGADALEDLGDIATPKAPARLSIAGMNGRFVVMPLLGS